MADDRTLADFFEGDDESDATDGEPDTADGDGGEPASPTYQWVPGGVACERCGTEVERRWRDGDAYVCGDCKEW